MANSKKKLIFQLRQFSIFFHENFFRILEKTASKLICTQLYKKSPVQYFITRTLARPETLYNFNYHNEAVAAGKICLASPISLFSQFNLYRFVRPLDQIDLAF